MDCCGTASFIDSPCIIYPDEVVARHARWRVGGQFNPRKAVVPGRCHYWRASARRQKGGTSGNCSTAGQLEPLRVYVPLPMFAAERTDLFQVAQMNAGGGGPCPTQRKAITASNKLWDVSHQQLRPPLAICRSRREAAATALQQNGSNLSVGFPVEGIDVPGKDPSLKALAAPCLERVGNAG